MGSETVPGAIDTENIPALRVDQLWQPEMNGQDWCILPDRNIVSFRRLRDATSFGSAGEFMQPTERNKARKKLDKAIGLIGPGTFAHAGKYDLMERGVLDISRRATDLDSEDISVAAAGLAEAIKARRLEDFAHQIEELNRYIHEDDKELWALYVTREGNKEKVLGHLDSFSIEARNNKHFPQLLLMGKDGTSSGTRPPGFLPLGLYITMESRS